jgi:serine-type D-Ala-D-Ala endopeptidase (penicillin-binding protein 7)
VTVYLVAPFLSGLQIRIQHPLRFLALVFLGISLCVMKPALAQSSQPAKTTQAKKPKSPNPKQVRTTVNRPKVANVQESGGRPSFATAMGLRNQQDELNLKSSVAMVVDQQTKDVLFEKNPDVSLPIASITKLMTAMVVLDSSAPLDEVLTITQEDVKIYAKSRLALGTKLTREEALLLALMSSENRASYILARYYPGGVPAFIEAMNHKAYSLGMTHSKFTDPTGLLATNVSTAEDLARMLIASYNYKLIREFSIWPDMTMVINKRPQVFLNTNRLVRAGDMEIGLQKTGFISAAGKCLVMQAKVNGLPLLLVFLDSVGTQSRFADAVRVKDWIERYQPGEPKSIRRLTM